MPRRSSMHVTLTASRLTPRQRRRSSNQHEASTAPTGSGAPSGTQMEGAQPTLSLSPLPQGTSLPRRHLSAQSNKARAHLHRRQSPPRRRRPPGAGAAPQRDARGAGEWVGAVWPATHPSAGLFGAAPQHASRAGSQFLLGLLPSAWHTIATRRRIADFARSLLSLATQFVNNNNQQPWLPRRIT
jgi:hypothetical protein